MEGLRHGQKYITSTWRLFLLCVFLAYINGDLALSQSIRRFEFHVKYQKMTRLCSSKVIPTVNGESAMSFLTRISPFTSMALSRQRGTLWWHAHNHWMRYTVYGALIILPKKGAPYPFATPYEEVPLVLGEWWKGSMDLALQQSAQTGKTYMLRIVNAAMNGEMFLSVADHKLTVVEVDATYTKPLQVHCILIMPGQTTNVLMTADQPAGRYYLAARPYIAPNVTLDNTTTTAVIAYEGASKTGRAMLPKLPAIFDSPSADNFSKSLRSLASKAFLASVPLKIDRHLFFTVGLAIRPCANCTLTLGGKLVGVINNISFELPQTALLQAHYFRKPNVFVANFSDNPTASFKFTGKPPANAMAKAGTRPSYLPFNSTVQLVLQSTSLVAPENHPIHLHDTNFFVVGMGLGNYNASSDPLSFNLVDPPERNTIDVPQGGWAALRFRAYNPVVWFMHCHLVFHTSAGLETAFVIENGPNPQDRIIPPPIDLPPC
ncbi:hypothetical protein GOP47_0026411 [Adiantum capillus-veneris]|nr:hypothetical protein GOP47_0026411 [Adiantum capillus-veneris]